MFIWLKDEANDLDFVELSALHVPVQLGVASDDLGRTRIVLLGFNDFFFLKTTVGAKRSRIGTGRNCRRRNSEGEGNKRVDAHDDVGCLPVVDGNVVSEMTKEGE